MARQRVPVQPTVGGGERRPRRLCLRHLSQKRGSILKTLTALIVLDVSLVYRERISYFRSQSREVNDR